MGRPMKPLCFIDVETTGLDPDFHEIIELAAIRVDPITWQIEQELELKVMPEHIETADDKALEINGFCPDRWKGAPSLEEAISQLRPLLGGAMPAGHNIGFDMGFLTAAWIRVGNRPDWVDYHKLDTVALAMPMYLRGEIDSLKLISVCEHLGIITAPLHRALADAQASLAIAKMLVRPKPIPRPTFQLADTEESGMDVMRITIDVVSRRQM